jgi:hypothetical protein
MEEEDPHRHRAMEEEDLCHRRTVELEDPCRRHAMEEDLHRGGGGARHRGAVPS